MEEERNEERERERPSLAMNGLDSGGTGRASVGNARSSHLGKLRKERPKEEVHETDSHKRVYW